MQVVLGMQRRHLFSDGELVGAGIACPFIVARLGGYDEDIRAIRTEEHHDGC